MFLLSCNSGIKYPEGGFDYPKSIAGKDTNYYRYPIVDFTKNDRFAEYFERFFYMQFEEPNLSIRPFIKETFRLTYSTAFGETVILSFNEDEILIKKGIAGGMYDHDSTKLNKLENFHLNLLRRWFPLEETKTIIPASTKYLDSLSLLYPELLDVNYFIILYDKATVRNNLPFTYHIKKISITKKTFRFMVDQINASGYWQLPPHVGNDGSVADGYSFTLEANTFRKYNIVNRSGNPSDKTDFPKLCQKIIVFAGLDKEIKLDAEWKAEVVKPIQSIK